MSGKFTNNRKSLSSHSVCVQLLCRRIIYAITVIKKKKKKKKEEEESLHLGAHNILVSLKFYVRRTN